MANLAQEALACACGGHHINRSAERLRERVLKVEHLQAFYGAFLQQDVHITRLACIVAGKGAEQGYLCCPVLLGDGDDRIANVFDGGGCIGLQVLFDDTLDELGAVGHLSSRQPGATIGLYYKDGPVGGMGEYPLYPNTCYALELNTKVSIPEWKDEEVWIMREETVCFKHDGELEYLMEDHDVFKLVK